MTELEYFRALIDLLAEHYELVGSDPDERAMARIRRDAATPQLISDDPRILEMIYGCTCSMQGISALDKGISAPSAFGCGG